MNLKDVDLDPSRFFLRIQDVFKATLQLHQIGQRFDLVFADPPYGDKNLNRRSESLAQKTLDDPYLPELLDVEGLLILGHTKRDTLTVPDSWNQFKTMKHGDSIFDFFHARPNKGGT